MKEFQAYRFINNFLDFRIMYNASETAHLLKILPKLLKNIHSLLRLLIYIYIYIYIYTHKIVDCRL
jgi:hypothetical protein